VRSGGDRRVDATSGSGDLDEATQAAMRRALALAEMVRGRTSPNPPVGAVILTADGKLAGEGATAPAGGPHAEITALRAAGRDARDGTAVVTLEPCAHTGRTGPCVDALRNAGVRTVVYAVDDPTADAGGGADRLRDSGITVHAGLESSTAACGALRPWLHAVHTGRPYVTWKYAATLDGRSAAADHTSQWISSAASRRDVHAMRAIVDAVVVGSGTVLADDPQLTVRDDADALAAHQPLRVVLDRRHRTPQTALVLDNAAETLLLDTAVPRFALKALYDRGVRHVLLEGGPTLAGAFVEAHCVDEVVAYLAPKLLGAGAPSLGDAGIETVGEAVTLVLDRVQRLGDDVKIVGRPVWPDPSH
jgi:diaminohydroxyphosphoribosylaminopyrimidine deaminase/5-amino-6-(5-phosphoribosylamino)uracil reductase